MLDSFYSLLISWMSPSAKAAKSNKKEFKAIFKKYNKEVEL